MKQAGNKCQLQLLDIENKNSKRMKYSAEQAAPVGKETALMFQFEVSSTDKESSI